MGSIGIVDLLALRGFNPPAKRTKLVRHRTVDWDIEDLRRRGWLDAYQSLQARPIFDDCEYVVSFVGLKDTKARLLGVYRVFGKDNPHNAPLPPDCPYTDWRDSPHYYKLEHQSGFEDLEDRVVIEWGGSARAWYQWLSNKEVVEVLPKGKGRPLFRDYLEFSLTHKELKDLYKYEDANREWKARLSAVAGVYLILATTTGAQYVGSAHGAEGIWGRWASYAQNGHGGNILLKRFLKEHEASYPASFSYSILQILPRTLAHSEVLGWESCYKEKLGSRATALNVDRGLNAA